AAAARALPSAFSANVLPSSGGIATPAGSSSSSHGRPVALGGSNRASSRRLCSLCVASSSSNGKAGLPSRRGRYRVGDRLLLRGPQLLDARGGKRQQLVQMGARKRC